MIGGNVTSEPCVFKEKRQNYEGAPGQNTVGFARVLELNVARSWAKPQTRTASSISISNYDKSQRRDPSPEMNHYAANRWELLNLHLG